MGYFTTIQDAYGNLLIPNASTKILFGTKSTIQSTADGYLLLQNNAATGFSGLRFGGTTSSFPAIYTNGPNVDIMLADGSDYANLNAKNISSSSLISSALSSTSQSVLYSSGDNFFKQIGGSIANPNGSVFGTFGDVYRSSVGDGYSYHWVKQTSSSTTGWEPSTQESFYDIFYRPYNAQRIGWFTDFNSLSTTNGAGLNGVLGLSYTAGGGTANIGEGTPLSGAGAGQLGLLTNTTTTGWVTLSYNNQSLPGLFKAFRGRVAFYLTTLSNGTDTYSISLGMLQAESGTSQREMLALKYTDAVNGGRFQLSYNNGGTIIDTGITVTANKFYVFDYSVPLTVPGTTATTPFTATVYNLTDSTSSTFTGLTIAANVTGASLDTNCNAAFILKSAGTTSRTLTIDFMSFDAYY